MSGHHSLKSSWDAGNRSSIFLRDSHSKRDLWWSSFRRTVLEPHNIIIHQDSFLDDVPGELLDLIETKSQNTNRYEAQALAFVDAVAAGAGFGESDHFPHEAVPHLSAATLVSRCAQPIYDASSAPRLSNGHPSPLDLPEPQPCLATGFASDTFSCEQYGELPPCLIATGTTASYSDDQIQQVSDIVCPFLTFEIAHDNTRHEVQAAANYCAMNGAASIKALQQFFSNTPHNTDIIAFTCALNNDSAIIYRHWLGEDASYDMAPLCKFDFRDLEHFMRFLAWIEAIEEWAVTFLHPQLCSVLDDQVRDQCIGVAISVARALPSPVTTAQKEEKLSQSMKSAFENIPWKGERPRNIPLGATMRMRNPRNTSGNDNRLEDTTHVPAKPRADLSIAVQDRNEDTIASPDTVVAISPPPSAPFAINRPKSDNVKGSRSTPASPAARSETKRRGPASFLSIKSATLPQTTSMSMLQAPLTERDPAPPSSRSVSTVASARTMPLPGPEQSPATLSQSVEIKSPAQSVVSVSSKKSFLALRSAKSLKSPGTPNSNASPRSGGFKSKFTGGLDAIRERTTPRRARADSAVPTSAKDAPLPTPAYDKKRFDIRPPTAPVPPTPKFWEQVLKPESTKESATAAYNASHVLPFRQYAKSPTVATVTTTITAGGHR